MYISQDKVGFDRTERLSRLAEAWAVFLFLGRAALPADCMVSQI